MMSLGRTTLICAGVFTLSESDMEGVHWFVQVYSHQVKEMSLWKNYIDLYRCIHTKQKQCCLEGLHWFVQVYSHQTKWHRRTTLICSGVFTPSKTMSLGRTTLICEGVFTPSKSNVTWKDYIDLCRCIHTKWKWHGRGTLICTGVFTPSESDVALEGLHWFVQVYSHQANVMLLWKEYIDLYKCIHTKWKKCHFGRITLICTGVFTPSKSNVAWKDYIDLYRCIHTKQKWCHLEGLLWFVQVYSHQTKVIWKEYIDLYRCIHTKRKWHGRTT